MSPFLFPSGFLMIRKAAQSVGAEAPEGRGTLGGVGRGSSPRFVTLSVKEYALWAYAALPFNGRRSNLYESFKIND